LLEESALTGLMRMIVGVKGVLITVPPALGLAYQCDLGRTARLTTAGSGHARPNDETRVHLLGFRFVEPPSAD